MFFGVGVVYICSATMGQGEIGFTVEVLTLSQEGKPQTHSDKVRDVHVRHHNL